MRDIVNKYDDRIIKVLLNDEVDEYGQKYKDVYSYELNDFKDFIICFLRNVSKCKGITDEMLAGVMLHHNWGGSEHEINIYNLTVIACSILDEITEKNMI